MAILASKTLLEPLKRPKISVLGVMVDDIGEKEAISQIIGLATDGKKGHVVATVNSEFVMLAKRDKEFAKILQNTDLNLPDGVGVVLSKLILGGREENRVTGTDLIEKLCEKAADLPIRVGFLGGFSNIAENVAKRQKAKFPTLEVAFAVAGDPTIGQDMRLRREVFGKGRVDLVFVAYGMGQQEFWIERNKKYLNVGVFMGVGGGFDYQAQIKARAPKFVRGLGMEWLWRLAMEPQRIWRMMVLPVFAVLVLGQFFGGKLGFSKE